MKYKTYENTQHLEQLLKVDDIQFKGKASTDLIYQNRLILTELWRQVVCTRLCDKGTCNKKCSAVNCDTGESNTDQDAARYVVLNYIWKKNKKSRIDERVVDAL